MNLLDAQQKYDFFETPSHHSLRIYNDYKPKCKVRVLDICCGLGSLVQPWYDNEHYITLIELNSDFIPFLKDKYPKANIIDTDFFDIESLDVFDVYLCNPPFNTDDEKKIYIDFFCKILILMKYPSVCYFICPKMIYIDQMLINIENERFSDSQIVEYIKEYNTMPAYYYYAKYNLIELHSNGFRFDKSKIKRMIEKDIIYNGFIDDFNIITPYFEFRFLGNIYDFQKTKCHCGLFKINK